MGKIILVLLVALACFVSILDFAAFSTLLRLAKPDLETKTNLPAKISSDHWVSLGNGSKIDGVPQTQHSVSTDVSNGSPRGRRGSVAKRWPRIWRDETGCGPKHEQLPMKAEDYLESFNNLKVRGRLSTSTVMHADAPQRTCEANTVIPARTVEVYASDSVLWYVCNYKDIDQPCSAGDVDVAWESVQYRCGDVTPGWDHSAANDMTYGVCASHDCLVCLDIHDDWGKHKRPQTDADRPNGRAMGGSDVREEQ